MRDYRSRKQAYVILICFILLVAVSLFTTRNFNLILSSIGMASVLLILELTRLREHSIKPVLLTILLALSFALFGKGYIKCYSLLILASLLPSLKIRKTKKVNYKNYIQTKNELETKQKELIKLYKSSRRKASKLYENIDRFSKLYELSKEIEQINNSAELAEKSLESLKLKLNIDKLAFYTASSSGYQVFKTRDIDEKTAITWLEDLINMKNRPGDSLFKFILKSGNKKLGLIICKSNLNAKQIKEAEVLIYQIRLGYEKTTLYEKVKRLSRIDGLTGLYLRMHFSERLSEEIKRAKRENYKIAFIMADLDDFKKYNDTYGHPMGDKLLKEVAGIIQNNIYSSDIAGRYGGEEFCIYMPMADEKGTMKKAQKIWKLIAKNTPTTISIGISYFPDNGTNPEDLFNASDSALYRAKENGKNQIVIS